MAWKSSVQIEQFLSELPGLEDVKEAFSLATIAERAVYPECFIADDE